MELIIGREAGASRLRISINNQDRFGGTPTAYPNPSAASTVKWWPMTKEAISLPIWNPKTSLTSMVCKSSPSTFPERPHRAGGRPLLHGYSGHYKRAGSINTQIVLYPSPTRSMGRISRHQTPDTDKRKEVCSNPFCNRRIFHVCHFLRIYSGHCRPAGFACHSIFCRTFIGHLFLCDNLPVIFYTSQISGRPW